MKRFGVLLLAGACTRENPPPPAQVVRSAVPSTPIEHAPSDAPAETPVNDTQYPVEHFAPLAKLGADSSDVFQVRLKPGQPRQEVGSCQALLSLPLTADLELEPGTEQDYQAFWYSAANCLAARLLADAKPSQHSLLQSALSADDPSTRLPPLLGLSDSYDERPRVQAAADKCTSWKTYDKTLSVDRKDASRFAVETDAWSGTLSLYARADFDGDGFEDLLVRRQGSAKGGSFTADAVFLLSQTDRDPCIRVVREFGRS